MPDLEAQKPDACFGVETHVGFCNKTCSIQQSTIGNGYKAFQCKCRNILNRFNATDKKSECSCKCKKA